MTRETLINRLEDVEWEDFEVKEARHELPKSAWETVSAFSMHTDYFSPAKPRIRIFDDRIEFLNPGALPEPLEKIMAEDLSIPRNPILAKLFRVAGLAENAGYGFDKMMTGWQRYSGTVPEFTSDTGFTKALFQQSNQRRAPPRYEGSEAKVGEKVGEDLMSYLTPNQQRMVATMKKNPYVSAKMLAKEVGISARKIEENIRKLKDQGIVRRIGPARGGHWQTTLPHE